jgi:hypothetical protein
MDVESTEVPLVDELIDDELALEPPDDTSDGGEDLSD